MMRTIATLGPENSFADIAARIYAARFDETPSIRLMPSFKKVVAGVGEKIDYAILPIENMVDGSMQPVLDLLLHSRLTIIDELLVPIRYALIANASSRDGVHRIFAQIAAQGQCSEFLDSLPGCELITTQSNGESLLRATEGLPGCAAIVPAHDLANSHFPFIIDNITDYENNVTRFIVLAEQETAHDAGRAAKTSLVIIAGTDRPGMLSDILSAFSKRGINLVSIMSRPTKELMGKYHFFIDIEGHALAPDVQAALTEVRRCGFAKLLGSYPKAIEPAARPAATIITAIPSLQSNPFKVTAGQPQVFIGQGGDPYRATREALDSLDLSVAAGKRVLLKPNAGRVAAIGSGIVTNPQVVAAAIDAFKEAGATVAIGESPITGVDTAEAFENSGIAAVARERGCACIDMDRRPPVEVTIIEGVALYKTRVVADLFDFDIVVSMPVMKMHMHTGVTLSVKNMKGCLWQRSKIDLHMLPNIPYCKDKPLNIAIADMASVLRPHLAIIDGTVGMEGLGPSAGEPKALGVVVAGVDPFAADSIACALMGLNAAEVPHLRIGAERGLGIIDPGRIEVSPPDWQRLISPFAKVPADLTIQYPNVNILDENSCSGCQSTVLLFLKRYGHELAEYLPADKPVSIVIGKGHTSVPPNSLCIGNCTRQFRELGLYVSGCPPVASSILKTLKKNKEERGG
jgi:prephenate dehydratase/uncharacterized protein (DUF362 family)